MKTEDYSIRIINNKLVLMNIYSASNVMVFDGISKLIIMKLIEGENKEQIIANISKEYKINYETVERDVCEFIEELKYIGIYNEGTN